VPRILGRPAGTFEQFVADYASAFSHETQAVA